MGLINEKNNEGICFICQKTVKKQGALRHIKSCATKNLVGSNNTYILQILGGDNFYMMVAVSPDTTLEELDMFLRDVWYECCGHLSQFCYEHYDEVSMNKTVKTVFKSKKAIEYQYDFGSTSYAIIKLVDKLKTNINLKDIVVLSQNNMPKSVCDKCDNKASYMKIDYDNDCETSFFCDKCVDEDDDYIFELVNSPRVGYCGELPDTDKEIKKYIIKINS